MRLSFSYTRTMPSVSILAKFPSGLPSSFSPRVTYSGGICLGSLVPPDATQLPGPSGWSWSPWLKASVAVPGQRFALSGSVTSAPRHHEVVQSDLSMKLASSQTPQLLPPLAPNGRDTGYAQQQGGLGPGLSGPGRRLRVHAGCLLSPSCWRFKAQLGHPGGCQFTLCCFP